MCIRCADCGYCGCLPEEYKNSRSKGECPIVVGKSVVAGIILIN